MQMKPLKPVMCEHWTFPFFILIQSVKITSYDVIIYINFLYSFSIGIGSGEILGNNPEEVL